MSETTKTEVPAKAKPIARESYGRPEASAERFMAMRVKMKFGFPEYGVEIERVLSVAPLGRFEQWMVRSNLNRIRRNGLNPQEVVADLRGNGYKRVADAVAEATKAEGKR